MTEVPSYNDSLNLIKLKKRRKINTNIGQWSIFEVFDICL